jgi:hypothetical protein
MQQTHSLRIGFDVSQKGRIPLGGQFEKTVSSVIRLNKAVSLSADLLKGVVANLIDQHSGSRTRS